MENFDALLNGAQQGEQAAIERLLLLYKPLIERHSSVNGHIDEDLQQFIILRILINLKNFH
jgi:glutaredoxin 2